MSRFKKPSQGMNALHVMSRLVAVACIGGLMLLAGCNSQSLNNPGNGTQGSTSGMTGQVNGGTQPVVNAHIAVTDATTQTTIGIATTDSNGKFNIASFSPTPGTGDIIYVTASGGSMPGQATNDNIKLATVAGFWNQRGVGEVDLNSQVIINEYTTVAMAYSLGAFADDSSGVLKLDNGDLTSLSNSVSLFLRLANPEKGISRIPDTNGGNACSGGSGEPANCAALRRLDTLANAAAGCVNASNSAVAPNPANFQVCNSLASATTPANGSAPANTFDALLNIARTADVRGNGPGISALAGSVNVFQPTLAQAPDSWAVALNYPDPHTPASIAVDGNGNVFVLNEKSADSILSIAGDSGNTTTLSNGLNGPTGLAIDANNNLWVTNGGSNSVSELTGTGTVEGQYDASSLKLNAPSALAISPKNGDVWVANAKGNPSTVTLPPNTGANTTANALTINLAGSVTVLDSSGTLAKHIANSKTNLLSRPGVVAMTECNDAVVFNPATFNLSAFRDDYSTWAGFTLPLGGLLGGAAITLHGLGTGAGYNTWVAITSTNAALTTGLGLKFPKNSVTTTPALGDLLPLLNGEMSLTTASGGSATIAPVGIAADSTDKVWISGADGNLYLFEGSTTASTPNPGGLSPAPSLGIYNTGGQNNPGKIAVDGSGNVWVTNDDSVTQYIGIAAPTVTPVVNAIGYDPSSGNCTPPAS